MNHIAILKKVLSELKMDNPKLDYIRGMVETLIEMQETSKPENTGEYLVSDMNGKVRVTTSEKEIQTVNDEGALLDAQAKAAMAKTMELANKSIEQ